MELVSEAVDEGEPVDIIYLDFQKAFDKVPHERLILKLKALGIGGTVLDWIREWLRGRKQKIVINGEYSEWADVTSGVPQGSVLGPVLFIIFINDIDENILNNIFKFADDTTLEGRVKTVQERESLHKDLKRLIEWSDKWKMKFNGEMPGITHW